MSQGPAFSPVLLRTQ